MDIPLFSLIDDNSGVTILAISGILFVKGRESIETEFSSSSEVFVSGVCIGDRVGMDLFGLIDFIEIPVSLESEVSILDKSVSEVYTGERAWMDLSRVIGFIEVPVSLLSLSVSKERELLTFVTQLSNFL